MTSDWSLFGNLMRTNFQKRLDTDEEDKNYNDPNIGGVFYD